MKIAIAGYSGYIGRYLQNFFQRDAEIELILRLGRSPDSDQHLDLL